MAYFSKVSAQYRFTREAKEGRMERNSRPYLQLGFSKIKTMENGHYCLLGQEVYFKSSTFISFSHIFCLVDIVALVMSFRASMN